MNATVKNKDTSGKTDRDAEERENVKEIVGSPASGAGAISVGVWGREFVDRQDEEARASLDSQTKEWDSDVTDEQLMLWCQKGRDEALEELYHRYHRPVLLFIFRIVRQWDLAEDLVQETFIRVYNNRKSWQPRSKFTSWLYRIARNLCIDEKRRYWNRKVHFDSQFGNPNNPSSFLDGIEDVKSNAREQFARKIDEDTIKAAINQLSEEQRDVIILNKYQGLSYIEIAEILGASPESIKQRAYRAHLKLRQILGPLLEEYA